MAIDFKYLTLVGELRSRAGAGDPIAYDLLSRLTVSINQLGDILNEIRVYFRHFTDHSINHSFRIIYNIGEFLSKEQLSKEQVNGRLKDDVITNCDLFLLIGTALIHDIGMVIPEYEFKKWMIDEKIKEKLDEIYAKSSSDICINDWFRYGIPRIVFAEYVRKNHANRSMEVVLNSNWIPKSLIEGAGRLGHWLGKIAASHSMKFEEICDSDKFPTRVNIQITGGMNDTCNPRFISLCLRIGDLLDIGTARACPLIRHISEPLSLLSKSHWDQYSDIEVRGLSPNNEIAIAGVSPSQDAERALREWVSWLEEEVSCAVTLQNQDRLPYKLQLGRIQYKVEPMLIDGEPSYEFLEFRFNLDEKMVFERLFGDALYGRKELALREIVQNAIDAQRAKFVYDLSKEKDWLHLNDEVKRKMLISLIKDNKKKYSIVIKYKRNCNDKYGVKNVSISISDKGIGMSREIIEGFLLKVGRSRWSNDPSVSKLGIGSVSIGNFGIGFLSCLMIASKVEIKTRSILPNQEGIQATIYGWQSYLATEPFICDGFGTEIILTIQEEIISNDIELDCVFAEICPLIDFRMILFQEREDNPIPQLFIGESWLGSKIQARFDLDNDGSYITILKPNSVKRTALWEGPKIIVNRLKSRRRQIVLCQDGITIAEVALPQEPDNESLILNNYQILIDLRGISRIPLDLSRNTVEGGQQKFWRKYKPILWDTICKNYCNNLIAFNAIADLVNKEFYEKEEPVSRLRFCRANGPMLNGLKSLENIDRITCIDVKKNVSQKILQLEGIHAWLMPSPDEEKEFALGHEDYDEINEIKGGKYYEMPPKFFTDQSDFYGYNIEDLRSIRKISSITDKEWNNVASQFNFVGKGNDAHCRFYRREKNNTYNIFGLFGFRVTNSWVSVLEPRSHRVILVPTKVMLNLPETAYESGLGLADFYLFLLDAIVGLPDKWEIKKGHFPRVFDDIETYLSKKKDEIDTSAETDEECYELDLDDEECYELDLDDEEEYERKKIEKIQEYIACRADDLISMHIDENGALFAGIADALNLSNFVLPWEDAKWRDGQFSFKSRS